MTLEPCFSQSDTLNQIDVNGKKQGYWILYGSDKPQDGWCDSCKIEEGNYLNNRKSGGWIKYYMDGATPKSKAGYILGRPSGFYIKYYPNGNIKESGSFIRGRHRGLYISYYEIGCVQRKSVYNKEVKIEDDYIYFNSCKLEYQKIKNEKEGYTATYFNENGEVEKVEELDFFGNRVSKTNTDSIQVKKKLPEIENTTPCAESELVKNDRYFKKNGYNKLYNSNKNLYLDGEFRNACLWNGKYYIYTEEGILIKIEIWKNGRYYSDGQL